MRHRRPVGILSAVAIALGFAGSSTISQSAEPKPSPWDRIRFLVGSWEGAGHGQPGDSGIERSYGFILRERFIEVRSTSTYQPQEKNPKGEVHEERGFISWDRSRRRFVLRQFHAEGFVNQYVSDSLASADSIVFTSESIENIPPGYRARETYRRLGPDAFSERFELAEPNSEFAVYSESRFTRKK